MLAGAEVLEEPGGELVATGGAGGAAVVPRRIEHEVVDDQLALPVEEVGQGHRALGALEGVVLLDGHHGQAAAVRVEGVLLAGELLLPGQQRLAGLQPLVSGRDVGQAHELSSPAGGIGGDPVSLKGRRPRRPELIGVPASLAPGRLQVQSILSYRF